MPCDVLYMPQGAVTRVLNLASPLREVHAGFSCVLRLLMACQARQDLELGRGDVRYMLVLFVHQ